MYKLRCSGFFIYGLLALVCSTVGTADALVLIQIHCFDDFQNAGPSLSCEQARTIPDPPTGNFISYGTAEVSANLATATIGASSFAYQSPQYGFGVNAAGVMLDRVTIPEDLGTGTTVRFDLHVTGMFDGIGGGGAQSGLASIRLLGGGQSNTSRSNFFFDGTNVTQTTDFSEGVFDHLVSSLTKDLVDVTLSVFHMFTNAEPSADLFISLQATSTPATAPGFTSSNFGNTASLDIILPSGLSFTSESGVLLSERTPMVPVSGPTAIVLMLSGFGVLGAVFLTQRRV